MRKYNSIEACHFLRIFASCTNYEQVEIARRWLTKICQNIIFEENFKDKTDAEMVYYGYLFASERCKI
jgi:hypothetical protein